MLKTILLLLLSLSLYAEGMDEAALQGIYTEALWFVAVITVMSVVSFVVSRHNAQKYEEKMQREKLLQQEETEDEPDLEEPEVEEGSEVDRLLELSKLHKEGLLTKEEFMAFKLKLYRNIQNISG